MCAPSSHLKMAKSTQHSSPSVNEPSETIKLLFPEILNASLTIDVRCAQLLITRELFNIAHVLHQTHVLLTSMMIQPVKRNMLACAPRLTVHLIVGAVRLSTHHASDPLQAAHE